MKIVCTAEVSLSAEREGLLVPNFTPQPDQRTKSNEYILRSMCAFFGRRTRRAPGRRSMARDFFFCR